MLDRKELEKRITELFQEVGCPKDPGYIKLMIDEKIQIEITA